jgi:hypothetical protein
VRQGNIALLRIVATLLHVAATLLRTCATLLRIAATLLRIAATLLRTGATLLRAAATLLRVVATLLRVVATLLRVVATLLRVGCVRVHRGFFGTRASRGRLIAQITFLSPAQAGSEIRNARKTPSSKLGATVLTPASPTETRREK